ncbi:VWA domain-containing protein [Streptomyces sp. NRRL S-118]|uniref:VWA domain-containing protein n=1 Tax=Streptomyces sp. NRRL S-118 TaxID=1463881 RepID=UPI0004CB791D|nr:VWA domain-containing protein [Streptomyces sp. NRRL S-118]
MGIRSLLRKVFGRDRAERNESAATPSVPPQTERAVPSATVPSQTPPSSAEQAAADLVAAAFDAPRPRRTTVPAARDASSAADAATAEKPAGPEAEAVAAEKPAEAAASAEAPAVAEEPEAEKAPDAEAPTEAETPAVAEEPEPENAPEAKASALAEEPQAEKAAPAEASADAEEPEPEKAPEAETPTEAETPAVAEEPQAEKPAPAEAPQAGAPESEAPADAEPVAVEVEEPALAPKAQEPAEEKPAAEAPAATPAPAEEAPQAAEPASTEKPAAAEEPASAEKPTPAAVAAAAPAGTEESATTDEQITAEEQAPTGDAPQGKPAHSLARVKARAPQGGVVVEAYKAAGAALKKRGLTGARAAVYLVLDRSGSMRPYYKDGSAQHLAEQALALAAHLDGSETPTVPVVFFSTEVDGTGEVTLDDVEGRIEALHSSLGRMGRTNYDRAINEVLDLHEKSGASDRPALVVFQTDGAPESKTAATQALADAAARNGRIQWQFVAFGEEDSKAFDYLRKLQAENAGFFHAGPAPRDVPHATFYRALLADWSA